MEPINQETDIRNVDRSQLVDITKIHIDEGLSGPERKKEYIRQMKYPYMCNVGKVSVKSVYTKGHTMNERFHEIVVSM